MKKGVMIGSDYNTEWLIPWWWNYYSRYNNLPVTLVDFGMSSKMVKWARKVVNVVPCQMAQLAVTQKKTVAKKVIRKWEKNYTGDLWVAREAWFKKPQAFLQTPYDLTLWIDTDCEICGSLKPIFEEWDGTAELALVKEERFRNHIEYNTGVVIFKKNAPFLDQWAERCLKDHHRLMGDQNVLTEMLMTGKIPFRELDPIYNWVMYKGVNLAAVVNHWVSGWGKAYVRHHGGLHQLIWKS